MNDKLQSPILNQFLERLRETAETLATRDNRPFKAELKPDFAGPAFNGSAAPSTTLSSSDLPTECIALSIGRYTLVLGVLPDTPTQAAVEEVVRRYRNQCVVARSHLTPSQSLDMQLMLLGPRGSDTNSDWDSLAKLVERDDRVARKLVWLMPETPERDDAGYDQFIKRTFLSRPWRRPSDFGDLELDKLSDADVKGDGLPSATVEAWEQIALDHEQTPDEIVHAIVKAWEVGGTV